MKENNHKLSSARAGSTNREHSTPQLSRGPLRQRKRLLQMKGNDANTPIPGQRDQLGVDRRPVSYFDQSLYSP